MKKKKQMNKCKKKKTNEKHEKKPLASSMDSTYLKMFGLFELSNWFESLLESASVTF